ncbi:MAG: TIR domain-containing protein [Lachnospiraceae bacterium]|nr:TIR domain-containing protein [Lachnospiraceae bacterium]
MINLKCKVCGGELVMQGDRIAKCEVCENLMLLPSIDSDVRNDMFNRGNYYRMKYEFDRAAQAFEQIIARDPEDVEARFCLALCHYGVEYVKDPRSGVYMSTCHRGNTYSILEDVDYLAAMEHAPVQIREVLKQQAGEIHRIWQQIMDIARYEEPYDVFICYKESPGLGIDPNERTNRNERTRDSVLAQELYEELTERGLRVFFSRISLENKLGRAYEPHIFAALQSAKVMLVVATRRDYVEAVWVKNEWQRFMHLRKQDRSREIIPVLRDMDEYDLPDEFADCIPRNIDETGVRQDLIRGILKITGNTQGNIGMIRNRELEMLAEQLLEQGNWADAQTAADQMLNLNPESGNAYKIQFLAEVQLDRLSSYTRLKLGFEDMPSFVRLRKYAKGDLKRELDEIAAFCQKREHYFKAEQLIAEGNYEEAYQELLLAGDYLDAAARLADCREKAEKQKRERELQENIERYQAEVEAAWDEIDSGWETLYPDVVAKGNLMRISYQKCDRPKEKGAVFGILLTGAAMILSMLNDGALMIKYYAFFGMIGLTYMIVLMNQLGKRLFPKMNRVLQLIIFSGVGFTVGGVLYFNVQEYLAAILVESLGETMALCISWGAVLAINMALSLVLFFGQAARFVKSENVRREIEYHDEVEVPELKRQLMARKLEELRGKYEHLIGIENCMGLAK